MATFSTNFSQNHLFVFDDRATGSQIEKLIDEAARRLNNRTVRINSLLIVSTVQAQQILAHCDSLNTNTRGRDVDYNATTVQFGLVADDRQDKVNVYEQVTFRYGWRWGGGWNQREINHLSCVTTYVTFRKSISKSFVEAFPALGK